MQLTDAEWSALIAYAHDEAAPEETALVRSLLVTNAGATIALQELQALRTSYAERTNDRFDANAALEVVRQRLEAEDKSHGTGRAAASERHTIASARRTPMIPRSITGGRVLRIAGVITAMIVATWGLTRSHFGGVTGQHGRPGRTYATTAGQRATLTLDDGTQVTLGPLSTLRLSSFSSAAREVSLEGEAYFDVQHAGGAPFVVRSGTVTTRVLGTAFLVRTGDAGRHVHVAVADGKINLYGPSLRSTGLTLTAGYIGEVTDSTVRISTVDEQTLRDGRQNDEFVFREVPVPKLLETLTHWYGYRFRCADTTLTQQRVTVVVSTRSSASALSALEQVLDVNIHVTGDTVTMIPQSSSASKRAPRMSRPQSYDVWTPKTEVGR